MRGRKVHQCEHVRFGLVHQPGQKALTAATGRRPCASRLGVVLDKGGDDGGGDYAPAALGSMGERIAHELDAAALSAGRQHQRGLGAPVGIRDRPASALADRAVAWRPNSPSNVSASEGPGALVVGQPRCGRRYPRFHSIAGRRRTAAVQDASTPCSLLSVTLQFYSDWRAICSQRRSSVARYAGPVSFSSSGVFHAFGGLAQTFVFLGAPFNVQTK